MNASPTRAEAIPSSKMDTLVLLIRKNIQLEASISQLQREVSNSQEALAEEKQERHAAAVSLNQMQKVSIAT